MEGREFPPHHEELAITGVIFERLRADDCLRPQDRESVAYRVAEIMVASKNLYTQVLPRLCRQSGQETAFDELAGLRMHLLHLADLIGDFEEAYMEAMANEREEDEEVGREDYPEEELEDDDALDRLLSAPPSPPRLPDQDPELN